MPENKIEKDFKKAKEALERAEIKDPVMLIDPESVAGKELSKRAKKKGKRGAPKGNKNAVGNPGGGRPTIYKKEYAQEILTFFDVEPFRKEIKSKSTGFGKSGNQNFEREEFMLIANRLPTLERFCMKIGIWRDTLNNWVEKGKERIDEEKELTEENAKNPDMFEFYRSFTRAKEIYKEFIIANGFGNVANPGFAIFLAKNTTDMKDKTETDITSGGKELGAIVLPATQPVWPAPVQENEKNKANQQ